MTPSSLRFLCSVFLVAFPGLFLQADEPADHGEWVMDESLWETSMADFMEAREAMELEYLSSAKRGLRSVKPGALFGFSTGEVLIKGGEEGGLIEFVTISIYNRGDDQIIPLSEMNERFEKLSEILTKKTGDQPEDRSREKAVTLQSLMWKSGDSAFLLEKSSTRRLAEFLRLRVAPLKTARRGSETANRRHLSQNVVHEGGGDVWIDAIPMVDQGSKGYCACATAARIYQYYGLQTTQHEIAQIAKAGPHTGTLPSLMVEALEKVTTKLDSRVLTLYEYPRGVAETDVRDSEYLAGVREVNSDVNKYQRLALKRGEGAIVIDGEAGGKIPRGYAISIFRARELMKGDIFREIMVKKSNFSRFQSQIEKYIDEGIPIAWSLQLGMFPEKGLPQARGGHMRLIIGYNKREKELIYSDSWGAGHEKKRMNIANAYCMTNLLLALPPLH